MIQLRLKSDPCDRCPAIIMSESCDRSGMALGPANALRSLSRPRSRSRHRQKRRRRRRRRSTSSELSLSVSLEIHTSAVRRRRRRRTSTAHAAAAEAAHAAAAACALPVASRTGLVACSSVPALASCTAASGQEGPENHWSRRARDVASRCQPPADTCKGLSRQQVSIITSAQEMVKQGRKMQLAGLFMIAAGESLASTIPAPEITALVPAAPYSSW
jgi:hypothetical protein